MKRKFLFGGLVAVSLVAMSIRTYAILGVGDIVYDPVNHLTQNLNFAKELGQWAQSFQNQMAQINQLVTQVRQYAQMIRMMGDPQQLVGALGVSTLGQSLGLYNIAQGYGSLMQAVNGTRALTDSAGGLYNDVISTPEGFSRNFSNYRVYEFQNSLRNTYQTAAQNYTPAAAAIKSKIDETQMQLDGATNDAQIAKLNVKMNSLIAQQQSLTGELQRDAFNSIVAANDAQNHRQMVQKANAEVMGQSIYDSRASLEQTRFSTLSYGNVDIQP
jgi:hypothetical protein